MFGAMIFRVCAVAAAGLMLVSGTAHAYPVKGAAELTHNELYKKGKLPKTTCKLVKGTTRASTTKYVTDLVACMSKTWKSSIPNFQPVQVGFADRDEKYTCNGRREVKGSFAQQCLHFIRVRLAADWIKAKDDSEVFAAVTDAWSGIVQVQTGIGEAWQALPNGGEQPEIDEQLRRLQLQTDCLTAASYKSLGLTVKNWKSVFEDTDPPEFDKLKGEGKLANRLSWSKKGYQAGGPSVCNTWKAPSSKVA
jgi:hypothetical protein